MFATACVITVIGHRFYGLWILDGFLKPTWFVGDATPMQVGDVLWDSNNACPQNEDNTICCYENESSDESEDE